MCEKCPGIREEITSKYGVVVVSMGVDSVNNEIHYMVTLGESTVEVIMPAKVSMAGAIECVKFIGEHITAIVASTSMAYMEHEAQSLSENVISDLEGMLREEAPDK
jgi:hypothetical protein